MHAPFCDYEVYRHEWALADGQLDFDAVAIPRRCGHRHHDYLDFEHKLQRFNPVLHLGFDLKDAMYLVFRWGSEPLELVTVDGPKVVYQHRFMQRVMDLKYGVNRRTPLGRNWFDVKTLPFGDWVLRRLAHLRPGAMTFDTSWFGKQHARHLADAETHKEKRIRGDVDAICNDMMSLADRGNPDHIKSQFHVNRTLDVPAGAAA